MRFPIATYTGDPTVSQKVKEARKFYRKRSSTGREPPCANEETMSFVRICKSCGAELFAAIKFTEGYTSGLSHTGNRGIKYKAEIDALSKKEKREADAIYKKAVRIKACPVCGKRLSDEKGFFLPDKEDIDNGTYCEMDFPNLSGKELHQRREESIKERFGISECPETYEEKFDVIAAVRDEADRASAKASAASYLNICDQYIAEKVSAKASEAKANGEGLKKYILHLIQLENNIYSLQQHLSELYYQRILNDRAVVMSAHGTAYELKESLTQKRDAYQDALKALDGAQQYRPDISVKFPKKPSAPVLGVPGLFNKKRVLAENEALTAKYQEDMEAYQKEYKRCKEEKERLFVEACKAAIAKAEAEVTLAKEALEKAERDVDSIQALETTPAPAKAIKIMLDKEIAEAERLLKATFAARNELYSYNIIFDKYRDAVSLCTIYEYLMAGRCASLEGVDGAYNIYENEVRMNRVITQLDTVISSLEEIKQNQYMMYRELQGIKTTLNSLDYTMHKALTSIQSIEAKASRMTEYMEHVAKNSDVIAHNTAATAYYSKVNAQLTNALGYMIALN